MLSKTSSLLMAICLICMCGFSESYAGDKTLIMPKELVDVADSNGYKQIENYYDFSKAMDPPFVYGYKPTDEWKSDKYSSAVFWCEKQDSSNIKYFLIIASKSDPWHPMEIDDVIEWKWGSFPGGLSLYEDTLTALDEFYYIDSHSTGPGNVKLTDKIISCGDGGTSMDFYKYNDRWLIRMWD